MCVIKYLFEISILIKILSTFIALVWSLSSMFSNMDNKFNFHGESLVTICTLIWGFPSLRMYPLVIYEITILCESLVTMFTLIGFLSCVCNQMCLESNILIKRLSIFIALVWYLSSVLSDMFIKSSFHRESLVTKYTLIWGFPSVHPHVDCELIILSESLVTLDRLKWSFSRVFLLMVYSRRLF